MNKKAYGFTIVELLIVIVIIGILAAISIVAYNGVMDSAHDSTVKNDLAGFAKKIEIVKSETGTYPQAFTKEMGFSFTRTAYGRDDQSRTLRYCVNPETDNYIMYARSKSGKFFKYTASNGLEDAIDTYGWGICGQIGIINDNPRISGVFETEWAGWVN